MFKMDIYRVSENDYRVATLSKLYLTVTGIIMPKLYELKLIPALKNAAVLHDDLSYDLAMNSAKVTYKIYTFSSNLFFLKT